MYSQTRINKGPTLGYGMASCVTSNDWDPLEATMFLDEGVTISYVDVRDWMDCSPIAYSSILHGISDKVDCRQGIFPTGIEPDLCEQALLRTAGNRLRKLQRVMDMISISVSVQSLGSVPTLLWPTALDFSDNRPRESMRAPCVGFMLTDKFLQSFPRHRDGLFSDSQLLKGIRWQKVLEFRLQSVTSGERELIFL